MQTSESSGGGGVAMAVQRQKPGFLSEIKKRTIVIQGDPSKLVVFVRGVQGMGKSHYIKEEFQKNRIRNTIANRRKYIVSNDDLSTYFGDKKYTEFTDQQLQEQNFQTKYPEKYMMKWNPETRKIIQDLLKKKMEEGITPLFVDNTFANDSELVPAMALATMYGYTIHIVEFDGRPLWNTRTRETPKQHWSPEYTAYRQQLDERGIRFMDPSMKDSGKNIRQQILWGTLQRPGSGSIPNFTRVLQKTDQLLKLPEVERGEAYRRRILEIPIAADLFLLPEIRDMTNAIANAIAKAKRQQQQAKKKQQQQQA